MGGLFLMPLNVAWRDWLRLMVGDAQKMVVLV